MTRRAQVWAVMRMELARGVSPWRNLWLFVLALAPALIIAAHAVHDFRDFDHKLEDETLVLSAVIPIFYVRCGIFFGCLGIFMRLFRGEAAERTLHYLFLAPIRREALVVGKFAAGAITAMAFFGTGVLASFATMYGHFAAGRAFVLHGAGLEHLGMYLLVTALACLGYGAVFLALSVVFKNPTVPAVVVLLWESINGILPAWLKHISVTYYLKPLFPVELPVSGFFRVFTVVAEPVPPGPAVAGLVLFAGLVVTLACWRMRYAEVSYSAE
jgi:ABC-type transport system involved in multi-copper enzyme maturation permease subunit